MNVIVNMFSNDVCCLFVCCLKKHNYDRHNWTLQQDVPPHTATNYQLSSSGESQPTLYLRRARQVAISPDLNPVDYINISYYGVHCKKISHNSAIQVGNNLIEKWRNLEQRFIGRMINVLHQCSEKVFERKALNMVSDSLNTGQINVRDKTILVI